jgi:hypothetical protein
LVGFPRIVTGYELYPVVLLVHIEPDAAESFNNSDIPKNREVPARNGMTVLPSGIGAFI